jgi:deoxyribodipyrimidine photo-lyase
MQEAPEIVWYRQDLRIADHGALHVAAATGRPVIPLFVLDDETPGRWKPGGASRWWLHHSLSQLGDSLARLGSPLILRRGRAAEMVAALAVECGAARILWNRQVEPHWRQAENELSSALAGSGIELAAFPGATLFDAAAIAGRNGMPLRVFTPFWKACLAAGTPSVPLPAPSRLHAPTAPPASDRLADWRLLPRAPDWTGGLREAWTPGEAGAQQRLLAFFDESLGVYARDRDRPEPSATSRLSPHLHFGEISPRQVWQATTMRNAVELGLDRGCESFLRELGWREFFAHALIANPLLADTPLQERFARFPWIDNDDLLARWQRGHTGYPIVDAGMRELWHTGWMHNRVRMVVASFLVKHLLIPWQRGEAWFWDTLVDADWASNAGGWQWVAGCGTDAAPYFRIFNPVLQGQRFDPAGDYVRRWLPELSRLSPQWIHRPWEAPADELAAAKVRLGATYPLPVVDHRRARTRALAAFAAVQDTEHAGGGVKDRPTARRPPGG